AALSFRFGLAAAGAAGDDVFLDSAHRFRWASPMRFRAAALMRRLPFGTSGAAAVAVGEPVSIWRSSAIWASIRSFCCSKPSTAAVMISGVSFVGMSAFRTIHVNAIFPVRSVAAVGGEFLENLPLNFVIKPRSNDGPGRMLIWDGPLQDTWLLQHPRVGLPIPAQLRSGASIPAFHHRDI